MNLKEKYLQSLYQTERLIKKTEDKTVEIVKHTQMGEFAVRKSLTDKSRGEVYHILKSLNHINIIKVLDVFEFEENTIVIEEYIPGQTLDECLKSPVEEVTVINWIEQICTALEFLHNQSPPIIHRDLKPSNIMLYREQIILIDFDIARTVKPDSNKDTRFVVTPDYAPPEQYGFAQTDARSDIYALGIVFRECLQGKTNKWVSVIEKCTAIDPEKRYQTVKEVILGKKRKERPIWKIALPISLGVISLSLVLLNVLGIFPPEHSKTDVPHLNSTQSTVPIVTSQNDKDEQNISNKSSVATNPTDITLPKDIPQTVAPLNNKDEQNISDKNSNVTKSNNDISQQRTSPVLLTSEDLAEFGPPGSLYANIAETAYTLDEFWGKRENLDSIIVIPDSKNELYDLVESGYAYNKQGNYAKARDVYIQATKITPKDAVDYNNRGISFSASSFVDNRKFAIIDFNKAIELNPQFAEAYYNLGNFYLFNIARPREMAIEDIIEKFNKAVELNPRFSEAYYYLGLIYLKNKKYDLAITNFTKSIQYSTKLKLAYFKRATAYFETGQYALAIADLDSILEIEPENKDAFYCRKFVLKRAKKL